MSASWVVENCQSNGKKVVLLRVFSHAAHFGDEGRFEYGEEAVEGIAS